MAFEATELDHEGVGIRAKWVLSLVGGFLVFVALMMTGLSFFYRDIVGGGRVEATVRPFPGPQLQPNPGQDYANFRHAQDGELTGYHWVDKSKTLVHVPIARAMDYVVKRGASAYDPLEQEPGAKLPPTPSDGESRTRRFPQVAPYGVHP